jgi:hypothetical protein
MSLKNQPQCPADPSEAPAYPATHKSPRRTSLRGERSMDCSSFVFRSLIAAGFLPKNAFIGNTETLFGLNGTLLKECPADPSEAPAYPATHKSPRRTSLRLISFNKVPFNPKSVSDGDALHCTYSKGCQNIAVTKAIGWMGDYSGLPVRYFRVRRLVVAGPQEPSIDKIRC